MNKRNIYWDIVRGFCIIAVMLIHTTSMANVVGVIWRQFINYAVPLFFFMAGYFCRSYGSLRRFYAKKFCRILVPLAIYSVFYAVPNLIRLDPNDNVFMVLTKFIFDWGYFPVALFQCILLYPLITKLPKMLCIVFAAVVYFISFAYYFVGEVVCPEKMITEYMLPHILGTSWLLMFVLGVVLRRNSAKKLELRKEWIFIGIFVSVLEALFWYAYFDSRRLAMTQIKPGSILLSILIAFYAVQKIAKLEASELKTPFPRIISTLGIFSYFIYLSHKFILKIISLFINGSIFMVYFIRPIMLICVMTVVAIIMMKIPEEKRRKLWWLGV